MFAVALLKVGLNWSYDEKKGKKKKETNKPLTIINECMNEIEWKREKLGKDAKNREKNMTNITEAWMKRAKIHFLPDVCTLCNFFRLNACANLSFAKC